MRLTVFWLSVWTGVLAGSGGAPLLAQQAKPAGEAARGVAPLAQAAAFTDQLNQPISLTFVETPLTDVLELLRDKTGLPIDLDRRALADAGIGEDTPLSFGVAKMPLRSALQHLLRPIDLVAVPVEGRVRLTTADAAAELLELRVYDVRKLVARRAAGAEAFRAFPPPVPPVVGEALPPAGREFPPIAAQFGGGAGGGGMGGGGMGGGGLGGGGLGGLNPVEDITDLRFPKTHRLMDADALEGLITELIAPESWVELGGTGSLRSVAGRMVIRQTPAIHDRIAAVLAGLDQLRQFAAAAGKNPRTKPPLSVEVPAATPLERQLREALRQPVTLEFVDTPLQDVLALVGDKLRLPLIVDRTGLDDIGVATDAPVNANLRNVSLQAALNLILRDLDLAWVIAHDALLITSREVAEGQLPIRLYCVGQALRLSDEPDLQQRQLEELQEVLHTVVAPDSWDSVGGPAIATPVTPWKGLIVSQTREAHAEIVAILEKLAEQRAEAADQPAGTGEAPQLERGEGGANAADPFAPRKGTGGSATADPFAPREGRSGSATADPFAPREGENGPGESGGSLTDPFGITRRVPPKGSAEGVEGVADGAGFGLEESHPMGFPGPRGGAEQMPPDFRLVIYRVNPAAGVNLQTLLPVLTEIIDPPSWKHPNHLARQVGGNLIIGQTAANHHRIQKLLTALGALPGVGFAQSGGFF